MKSSIISGLLAACTLLAAAPAGASGSGPYDAFVNRSASDIAPRRYQAGQLGVVLPGFERVYLYAAWRSVALGTQGLAAAPNPDGALERALGSRNQGWQDTVDGKRLYQDWRMAIASALKQPYAAAADGDALASGYLRCPAGSYTFATSTLAQLARRADATPERLNHWIADQRQVFKFCGDDPSAQQRWGEHKPAIAAIAELPASVTLYWRQMQQYQLAAAAFHDGDYVTSARLFGQIGAYAQHPLRQWGAYLNLRSQARAASLATNTRFGYDEQGRELPRSEATPAQRQLLLATVRSSAEAILRDPALSPLHEATRAVLRSMLARLTPQERFNQLSMLLDQPSANPYLEDHLGDWRVLANDLLSSWGSKEHLVARTGYRKRAGFIDWIQTVQGCPDRNGREACAAERGHAVERWRTAVKSGDQAQSRVWLMAAAMLGEVLPDDVRLAALQVPDGAPEYLTVRHALARDYRLSGKAEAARALSDAVLAGPVLAAASSGDARNLFQQERFAVASTPADAANYLMRTVSRDLDEDTGEQAARKQVLGEDGALPVRPPLPAADGLRWLNRGLSVADLYALAAHPSVAASVRARIAVAAWLRADLLGQNALALKAAARAAELAPSLAPAAASYAASPAGAQRRHGLLLNALRYGLSPEVSIPWTPELYPRRADADVVAGMWCKLRPAADASELPEAEAERVPPMPEVGDIAARAREQERLARLKTATGFIGDHVMARAASTPADPDLPWLLYVVVQSTRGGCLDSDAGALSKRAYSLLHKRYPEHAWTRKTPYFY